MQEVPKEVKNEEQSAKKRRSLSCSGSLKSEPETLSPKVKTPKLTEGSKSFSHESFHSKLNNSKPEEIDLAKLEKPKKYIDSGPVSELLSQLSEEIIKPEKKEEEKKKGEEKEEEKKGGEEKKEEKKMMEANSDDDSDVGKVEKKSWDSYGSEDYGSEGSGESGEAD